MNNPPAKQRKGFNPRARHQARRSALQAMYQWHITNVSPVEMEVQFLNEESAGKIDGEYFKRFLYGIPSRYELLDQTIAPYLNLKRSLKDVDPIEISILRVACFELLDCLETPYRVVINEWLELAKQFGAEESYKFVNGVLDRLARELRKIECGADGHGRF
jgi:N utilization substance protein B